MYDLSTMALGSATCSHSPYVVDASAATVEALTPRMPRYVLSVDEYDGPLAYHPWSAVDVLSTYQRLYPGNWELDEMVHVPLP